MTQKKRWCRQHVSVCMRLVQRLDQRAHNRKKRSTNFKLACLLACIIMSVYMATPTPSETKADAKSVPALAQEILQLLYNARQSLGYDLDLALETDDGGATNARLPKLRMLAADVSMALNKALTYAERQGVKLPRQATTDGDSNEVLN